FDYGWRFNEQPRRLLTFALSHHMVLPPGKPPRYDVHAVDDPSVVIDSESAVRGAKLFSTSLCVHCHGITVRDTGSIAPDLRESVVALHWDAFRSALHDGLLAKAGMPKFDDLQDQEMRDIFTYIRQQARAALAAQRQGSVNTQ